MNTFEYLSVLISIILGLGMSHLLVRGTQIVQARLIQGEGRVRVYWVQGLWAFIIFIVQVQFWWAFLSRDADIASYTFFTFLFLLLTPVLLFVISTLVLPELEIDEELDLREYYFRSRGWVFTAAALVPLHGLVEAVWLRGIPLLSPAAGMQVALAALLLSVAVVRSPRYHGAAALAALSLILAFIRLYSLRVA